MDESDATSKLVVPMDIERFHYDYEHSKFLECNRELARQVLVGTYKQNNEKNKRLSKPASHIQDILQSFNKHYWLAGGTLLGI